MDPLEIDLPTLTTLAGAGVTRWILAALAENGMVGVKPSHGYVIQRLVDDEPTVGAVAAALNMTQQGASKQIADLERLGYVERITTADDRRERRVRLTTAGRGLLESGRSARHRLEQELVARVGADQVAAAKETMSALLDVLGLDARVRTRTVPTPEP